MDGIKIGSKKEWNRDKRGMMYSWKASASTMGTSNSELDEDDEGECGKGNGEGRRKGVDYCDYVR
jgi:hypothetical protein